MRIGFDAKRAFLNYSGLGNYSRSVIESLAQFYADENYFLFAAENKNELFKQALVRRNVEMVSGASFSKTYWRSYGQVNDWKKLNIDVYHGLSNELPFGFKRSKAKTVVTIHDLIFRKQPFNYKFIDRNIYDIKTKYACKRADKIISISNQTKNDIVDYYGINEKKVEVIHPSLPNHITRIISMDMQNMVKQKYQLPQKFILYTGTIEKRKNLLTVIKAINNLADKALPLIAVGKKTSYFDEIKDYLKSAGKKVQVAFLTDVNNNELNIIYSLSSLFIYTSLFEGFGIPLIEASAHGIPSITTKNSCMEEAAGNGALYIDPLNVDETSDAISNLSYNSHLHKQLSTLAIAHSSRFNSRIQADQLMKTYREL